MRTVSEGTRRVGLACMAALIITAGVAGAVGPSPAYQALLEAAKAEGKAMLGGFAFDPEEVATLEKGFKKRFGFPVKLTHDPTHIRDLPPKVIAGGFDVVHVNVAGGAPDHGIGARLSHGGLVDVLPRVARSLKPSTTSGRRRTPRACSISTPSLASYTTPNW